MIGDTGVTTGRNHWCAKWCTVSWCTELVHSALVLCPGVRSLYALIAWQGAQTQCSTLVNNSGAVPWCRGLVPPTKCHGLTNTCNSSPSFFNAAPTLPSYHQRSRTSNRRLIIMNWCCHIDNRSYSPKSDFTVETSIFLPFFTNNLLCSCSSLWDFFSLLGANYWHFCITKWFLAPKCPLEWFDKI